MHIIDFISNAGFDILFNNFLSNIYNLDLTHLQSEIQNPLASFNKKSFLKSDDNINSIDLIQLWFNAYANIKDLVYNIIIFFQQNLQ